MPGKIHKLKYFSDNYYYVIILKRVHSFLSFDESRSVTQHFNIFRAIHECEFKRYTRLAISTFL